MEPLADGTVVRNEAVALSHTHTHTLTHTHSIQTAAMPGWLPPYHVSATVGYAMQLAFLSFPSIVVNPFTAHACRAVNLKISNKSAKFEIINAFFLLLPSFT